MPDRMPKSHGPSIIIESIAKPLTPERARQIAEEEGFTLGEGGLFWEYICHHCNTAIANLCVRESLSDFVIYAFRDDEQQYHKFSNNTEQSFRNLLRAAKGEA